MTEQEYRKITDEMIYLIRCVINGDVPDKARVEQLSLEQLYSVARYHMLTAIVCCGLEAVGMADSRFLEEKGKAISRVSTMEMEKIILFSRFEAEHIRYMPLKGIVIKDFYPYIGMRQMADFDILYDGKCEKQVKRIMKEQGFTCKSLGKDYHKPPVSNFEMHTELFGKSDQDKLYEYYHDVQKRIIKDSDNGYGYHFSDEDLYIYLIAHEFRHYYGSGTGLRYVMDTYVFWKKKGSTLDKAYIDRETAKMGIDLFEQKNRQIAFHLFNGEALDAEAEKMLEYMIFSGAYGNINNILNKNMKECGSSRAEAKRMFIKNRLFLPMAKVREYHPFFYRHKFLLPFLFFYRLGRALTVKRKDTVRTWKALRRL